MSRVPRIRVGVVLVDAERVLLVEHRKDDQRYWLLPGGGLELGETLLACAAREVREETGLQIEPERILYLSEAIAPAGGRHILNVFVKARQVGGELGVPTDDVITRVEWVPLAELPHLTLYPAIAPELLRSAEVGFQHEILHLGARWT